MWVNLAIVAFGLVMAPMFQAGVVGAVATMVLGMSLIGLVYGPLGTVLSELFPTAVRYTGSSLTFNLAGIFGASLAPYAATWLAWPHYKLDWPGKFEPIPWVYAEIIRYLSRHERIEFDRPAFSCVLGGPEGRTLFALTTEWRGFDTIDATAAQRTASPA